MSTFIERRELMRTISMIIAMLYIPILRGVEDEKNRTIYTIITVIGIVYAVIYDYLYFMKGEN